MNILLVDGNEKEASDRYIKLGMDTQYEVYKKILKKYSINNPNITIIIIISGAATRAQEASTNLHASRARRLTTFECTSLFYLQG